jgi:hypothetical protein
MSSSRVTEAELAKKGLEYEKVGDPVIGYNVEKNDLRKLGDYAVLVALTPITAAIDTAAICAVVVTYMWWEGMIDGDLMLHCP